MNIFVNILVPILCLLIGYIMGSANISIPLGKMKFGQDPREYGSHNPGATNCGRLWGRKYFLIVFFFDVFKTLSPLYICWALLTFVPFNNGQPLLPTAQEMYRGLHPDYMIQWPVYWLAVIGAMFGGIYPCFIGFKGGKAASCMVGITLTTSWLFGVIGALSYYIVLRKTKYVSLASIITSWLNALVSTVWALLITFKVFPGDQYWMFIVNWGPMLYLNFVYAIVMTVIAIVLTIRHRTNITRIKDGTERKITWMDGKKAVKD